MPLKKAVIIGGGFVGAYASRKLENSFDVTLIDTKDYFEFTPSVLRTLVEPEHIKKIQIPHVDYLTKTTVIKGNVTKIIAKEVATEIQTYPYDYLIIGSGSSYTAPMKEEGLLTTGRADELSKYADKLKNSSSVLIIGGGLVGVELAGEITEKYPSKKVIIVHSKNELLERNPKKAREYAFKFLKDRNVELIFNEKVIESKEIKHYKTNKDRIIKTDIAFLCVGIKPNYWCLSKNLSYCLNQRKAIIVNGHMQVKGFSNVFAAGDITDVREEKTAQNAEKQAEVVVDNIFALDKGGQLHEYKSKPRAMIISLGKRHGILVYKNYVLTGIIPGFLKSFVEWKEIMKYHG